jgi:hypothetical protein
MVLPSLRCKVARHHPVGSWLAKVVVAKAVSKQRSQGIFFILLINKFNWCKFNELSPEKKWGCFIYIETAP